MEIHSSWLGAHTRLRTDVNNTVTLVAGNLLCRSPRCLLPLFNWKITHLRYSRHREFMNCNPLITVCQETNHVFWEKGKKKKSLGVWEVEGILFFCSLANKGERFSAEETKCNWIERMHPDTNLQNVFWNVFRCLSATEAPRLKVENPGYNATPASGRPVWAYFKADVCI